MRGEASPLRKRSHADRVGDDMKPFPEDQHTVQESLLRGFAGDQKFLRERCRNGTDRRVAAKKATVGKHFYSFVDSTGELSSFIEDELHYLENDLPRLRSELQSKGRLSATDKHRFDLYVAYSLVRTKTAREYMRQLGEQLLPLLWRTEVAAMFNIDLSRLQPDTLRYFDQFSRHLSARNPRLQRETRVRELRTFIYAADTLAKDLRAFEWGHVEFDAPCLVTSDAGVGIVRASTRGGLLPKDSIVVLPFSPTSLAVGRSKRSASVAGEALARSANRAMAVGAFEQVLRHPDMEWPTYLELEPFPPSLAVTITSGAQGTQTHRAPDSSTDLRRAYQSKSLDPFSRHLLDVLVAALPI